MKKIKIIIIGLALGLSSCQDPFELTPQDIFSNALVYEDEALADAVLADLYARALFQIVNGQEGFNMNVISSFGGESRNYAPWQGPYGQVIGVTFDASDGAGYIDYWPYEQIRECNDFIANLATSSLDPGYITNASAEARFIRAHAYFEMAKRFGGVPLITAVQDPAAPAEELYVPRNSEKEIYDFIGSELDEIVEDLPSEADDGRITRWAALAFKSRAMLYAASVAQFGGGTQLDGIIGFNESEANGYYQESLDASNEILTTGPFELYRRNEDPERNFIDLFIDEDENPEIIFAEKWDATIGKGHSWDYLGQPDGLGQGWNSNHPVYKQVFELFDFVDGSSGDWDDAAYDGTTLYTWDEFFGQRDPRMRASISHPEMEFRGNTIYYHSSTIYTDPESGLRVTNNDPSFTVPANSFNPKEDWPAAGASRNQNSSVTSLQIRKRLDESLTSVDSELSNTDFIVFRLGEVILNYVEAAYYLGDPNGDMLLQINDLRDRAGMPDFTSLTEDVIRKERRTELAFEEHVFWDLRRWRIAHIELDQVQKHRFFFTYDFDAEAYLITIGDGDGGRLRSHTEANYYYSLGLDRLADNPSLVDNPGY